MGRQEMKVILYLGALLVCLGAQSSKADWGVEKRKFVSISNRAKSEALIQCKQSLNKTVKPGEKIRWGVPKKGEESMICHVDVGGKDHGYMCMFLEEECKKECKWRVYDGGILKLKLGSGEWKSFELMADEESARSYNENDSCDDDEEAAPATAPAPAPALPPTMKDEGNSPYPSPKNRGAKLGWPRQTDQNNTPAPAPLKNDTSGMEAGNIWEWKSPVPAPAPAPIQYMPSSRRKLKPRNPRAGMLAPINDNMTPPMKHAQRKSTTLGAPSPTTFPKWGAPTPAPSPPPPLKQTPEQPGDAQLPQPGSTFYTCIKEDSTDL